jgi:hypothetical protein
MARFVAPLGLPSGASFSGSSTTPCQSMRALS